MGCLLIGTCFYRLFAGEMYPYVRNSYWKRRLMRLHNSLIFDGLIVSYIALNCPKIGDFTAYGRVSKWSLSSLKKRGKAHK